VRPAAQKTPSAVGQAAARKMRDPTEKARTTPRSCPVVAKGATSVVEVLLPERAQRQYMRMGYDDFRSIGHMVAVVQPVIAKIAGAAKN
jgi:hypothetical protein